MRVTVAVRTESSRLGLDTGAPPRAVLVFSHHPTRSSKAWPPHTQEYRCYILKLKEHIDATVKVVSVQVSLPRALTALVEDVLFKKNQLLVRSYEFFVLLYKVQ